MKDVIETISKEIESSEPLSPHIIDVESIENTSAKFIDLINNEDEFKYNLKNKYYTFRFKEPIYINTVTFSTKENTNLHGLEIVSTNIKDELNTIIFDKKEYVRWLPNNVIKEFKIKAPKRLFNKIILTKIKMLGFSLNELGDIEDKIEEISNYKKKLNEITENLQTKNEALDEKITETDLEIEEKNETIESLKTELKEIKIELQPLKEEKDELLEKVNSLKFDSKKLSEDITESNNNASQLKQEIDKLNKSISNKNTELKELTNDKNVFAVEMSSYNKQSNDDVKLYTLLSIIPWILISIVTYAVFHGTAELSSIYSSYAHGEYIDVDLTLVFWSRLPFAIITSTVLYISYQVSLVFIKNIIRIKKQKRTFTKINIIANDVADKSALELEISDTEKLELRNKLKMNLLREHLKTDIGENYDYEIKSSIWDVYLSFMAKLKGNEKNSNSKEVTNE